MNEEPMLTEPNLSPQSVVDSQSLANCMNKNKESLKVKLMLRRSMDVLVDQGILPPPNASPTFYEQKMKLERAKTGDYLKHKIQQRPQRTELIQQHILEDVFDPSYYEQERKLKRARLADDLNERLSHRPGPLELIKGNILHTDEYLEQAVKDGQITFKKTCEGEIIRNPPKRFVFEEESSSDSSTPSPSVVMPTTPQLPPPSQNQCNTSGGLNVSTTSAPPPPASFIVSNNGSLVPIPHIESSSGTLVPPQTTAGVLNAATTTTTYIVTTPGAVLPNSVFITTNNTTSNSNHHHSNAGTNSFNSGINNTTICSSNNKPNVSESTSNFAGPIPTTTIIKSQIQNGQKASKKKIKSKSTPKARIIKFHEYTGPPNVKKQTTSGSNSETETSYELLLKQQQLFLQLQLENKRNSQNQSENATCALNQNNMPEPPKSPFVGQSSNDQMKNENGQNGQISNSKISDKPRIQIQAKTAAETDPKKSVCDDRGKAEVKGNPKNFTPSVKKIISKLEDMKVSDLKAELKKRNLPVSGAKQKLIERLKPFSESVVTNNNAIVAAERNATVVLNQKMAPSVYQNDVCNNNLGSLTTTNPTTIILSNPNTNCENFQTVPVQLKQTNPITIDGTTLTIPIGNHTFIPQYHVVSSTSATAPAADNKIQLNGLNTSSGANSMQSPLSNNILTINGKLNTAQSTSLATETALNYTSALNHQLGDGTSNLAILTSPRIQLAQIDDRLSLNLGTTILPSKLVGIQNSGPIIHQLLLYPNTINASQEISNDSSKHHRSNSLPSQSLHPLQRNTSLPLIINQMPLSQIPIDSNFKLIKVSDKMPTLVEQATKQTCSSDNSNQRVAKKVLQTVTETKPMQTSDFVENMNVVGSSVSKTDTEMFAPMNDEQQKPSEKFSEPLKPMVDQTSKAAQDNGFFNSNYADSSGQNQIQPDSTTSSSNLDFDLMLNFDDLNGFDDSTKTKNDEMIDFNDNWLDFGDASNYLSSTELATTTIESNVAANTNHNKMKMENSDTIGKNSNYPADNFVLESINHMLDAGNDGSVMENNHNDNYINNNYRSMMMTTRICNQQQQTNDFDRAMNAMNNPIATNMMQNEYGDGGYQSATSSNNPGEYNSLGNNPNYHQNHNHHHHSSMDSFISDLFNFEDNDFKNSMDFPILMDKIDFAT